MTEDKLTLERNDDLGEIVIAPEVLEVIIGVAAAKVEGVYGMRGTFAGVIAEKLGRQSHGKGINLSTNEDGTLSVDIYSYLQYGVSVPKVAMEMQEKVKQQVLYMTGIDLSEVNIHIVAVVPEKLSQLNPEDFLDDEEDESSEE
ncbi:Uncharacterized conserved protein YloU, alkaline shock protein (Asp23) family [Pilibacter termitis]|uniref:Uncharacterized conserved protein YloU, alkaline shock protein (Asp23) family n=1 Tax=Pilibacter termitis TaxID=263852 RepID=A0A1T4NWB9_9ENTE|nr:Asp23/Gls24 family envelope stress response protein [Pilibacter termitis]SJZ83539.1 Uncharacterized conserved protein YloU, alkaline shock protein (Asp23) family [Pilibacter termitis]